MNRFLHRLFLVGALCALFVVPVSADLLCQTSRCQACRNAEQFAYGLDRTIYVGDTVWFKASFGNVAAGLSAYWFSDNATIMAEAYTTMIPVSATTPGVAACLKDNYTAQVKVGKGSNVFFDDQMVHNYLVDYFADSTGAVSVAESALNSIEIYVGAYIVKGDSGRVVCNRFNETLRSSCSDLMPLLGGVSYVLAPGDSSLFFYDVKSQGKDLAMQWLQANNDSMRIDFRIGSCDNALSLSSLVLNDSVKLVYANPAMLDSVDRAGDSLFVMLTNPASIYGRLNTFAPVEFVNDTLFIMPDKFPYDYKGLTIDHFGDYVLVENYENKYCPTHLHVLEGSAVEMVETVAPLFPTAVRLGESLSLHLDHEGAVQLFDLLGRCLVRRSMQGETYLRCEQAGTFLLVISTDNQIYKQYIFVY